jgi:uncharacterized repeat protein (TIGR03803 family)
MRVAVGFLLTLSLELWAAPKEKVLHSFGDAKDGSSPNASLVFDAAGNLYGTTEGGGSSYNGTVFELSPSQDGKWTEKVIYDFAGGEDGRQPESSLVFDASGNLYGTTAYGGPSGEGMVFRLTPSPPGWVKTVIYGFGSHENDGAKPTGPLVFDAAGNLYGTTVYGGSPGGSDSGGTVFQLVPPPQGNGLWTENILCAFGSSCLNGKHPWGGVVLDAAGNLYGTTRQGGINSFICYEGCGTVFEIQRVGSSWKPRNLYHFKGGGNAGWPNSGVVLDAKGDIYGTASEGGAASGIVFRLRQMNGGWKESVIYSFCTHRRCSDGNWPWASLAFDLQRNLYGTTLVGGNFFLHGTVFKLRPTRTGWEETVLYSFGNTDGDGPTAGVVLDNQGAIFGVTREGGKFGGGVVFQITP